ncbi:unnamed protein product [Medioppia subpectinata]|uniref:Co-chaperone HscB C-terminal oligomerisation domain-containing protein n=1 Tax=Medioppia subpectinata TaxID=1979941 RepID=A0A7R9KEI0_9ACAR|nr:unnamed protein product [Medioppia subpectinata]CAG2100849.1 unnamed protein product [Medioppia subpectinata]
MKFKKLQMATHPDKWVNASHREHTYSMDNSSLINKAYKTLRDPYERGVYLLNILFNTQIQENETRFDSQFLSEIMKVNEDIEENIVSKNKLMNIFTDNEKNMKKVMHDMSLAFESNDI